MTPTTSAESGSGISSAEVGGGVTTSPAMRQTSSEASSALHEASAEDVAQPPGFVKDTNPSHGFVEVTGPPISSVYLKMSSVRWVFIVISLYNLYTLE